MPTEPRSSSTWQRRMRRLLFLAGTVSTIYFLSSYALDRMREARVRAIQEKRKLDLMKSHFTTLISTMSITLYALLPTLGPQLAERYPVEWTSQALQDLSNPVSSTASIDPTPDSAPAASTLLHAQYPAQGEETNQMGDNSESEISGNESSVSRRNQAGDAAGVGESWASEFERRESDTGSGSELLSVPETDEISSTVSQSISLPPTDISSTSGSPTSDVSHGAVSHTSPPRGGNLTVPALDAHVEGRSKKELWKDLKIQSLTRAVTTAYLLPLLYILTTSQLATLSRLRYLQDVKSDLPPVPQVASVSRASGTSSAARKGWFSGLSIEALGLSGFVDETTSLLPNPVSMLPNIITSRLPAWIAPSTSRSAQPAGDEVASSVVDEELARAEAERMYLTYSWWILNEGWKGLGDRVEDAVHQVFGRMALKRDLSIADWDGLVREVRLRVDMDDSLPYDFTTHILPSNPLPPLSPPCPLPIAPPSAHLASLLDQTRQHLDSADARYLLQKAADAVIRRLLNGLSDELYTGQARILDTIPTITNVHSDQQPNQTRRLVDCLPVINRWGRGVWEGIPDGGVEALLALPEFESFAALVFGDWAPR